MYHGETLMRGNFPVHPCLEHGRSRSAARSRKTPRPRDVSMDPPTLPMHPMKTRFILPALFLATAVHAAQPKKEEEAEHLRYVNRSHFRKPFIMTNLRVLPFCSKDSLC